MAAPSRPAVLARRSLISLRWRPAAFAATGLGLLVLAALAAVVFHGTTTSFDTWAFVQTTAHIGPGGRDALFGLDAPAISVALLVLVGIGALVARRADVLALAISGPIVATMLTEAVLKPAIGRLLGPHVLAGSTNGAVVGSFPSGHETVAASTAVVIFLAACQLRPRGVTLAVTALVLTVWIVAAAVGLVRNYFHYATDTVGAVGLSVAVVVGLALLIDRCSAPVEGWWRRRTGQLT